MALRSSETSFTRVAHPIGAEHHRSQRAPWLRAAVLGANDGILSTSALVIGVAAANTGRNDVIIAGVAAIVAGALSMAVGEYVSVSSQRDAERADLDVEAEALRANPRGELNELARIYQDRGVEPGLARLVARAAHGARRARCARARRARLHRPRNGQAATSGVDLGRRVHRGRDLAGPRSAVA